MFESKDDLKDLEEFAELTAIYQCIIGTRNYPDIRTKSDYEHD